MMTPKEKKIELEVTSIMTPRMLLNAINMLTDDEKASLAIKFGENGEMNYEYILLLKLIDVISEVYPPNDDFNEEASRVSELLLNIKGDIEKLIDR